MRGRLTKWTVGVGLAALTLGACASQSGGGSADEGLYDDAEDVRADGSPGGALQNRATWARRLQACKTQFDSDVASTEVDSVIPAIDAYRDCLALSNDRTIARTARNQVSNGVQEPSSAADIAAVAAAFRKDARDYCELATGVQLESLFDGGDAGLFALAQNARCKLDVEIDLARRIGEHLSWADVTGESLAFDVSFLREDENDETFRRSASTPECSAAYDAANEAALSTADYLEAASAFEGCVRDKLASAVETLYGTPNEGGGYSASDAADYVARTVAAFDGALEAAGSHCAELAQAGDNGGGTLARVEASGCLTGVVSKLALWIDDQQPLEPADGASN